MPIVIHTQEPLPLDVQMHLCNVFGSKLSSRTHMANDVFDFWIELNPSMGEDLRTKAINILDGYDLVRMWRVTHFMPKGVTMEDAQRTADGFIGRDGIVSARPFILSNFNGQDSTCVDVRGVLPKGIPAAVFTRRVDLALRQPLVLN